MGCSRKQFTTEALLKAIKSGELTPTNFKELLSKLPESISQEIAALKVILECEEDKDGCLNERAELSRLEEADQVVRAFYKKPDQWFEPKTPAQMISFCCSLEGVLYFRAAQKAGYLSFRPEPSKGKEEEEAMKEYQPTGKVSSNRHLTALGELLAENSGIRAYKWNFLERLWPEKKHLAQLRANASENGLNPIFMEIKKRIDEDIRMYLDSPDWLYQQV